MAGLEGRALGGYQLAKQIGAGAITEVFRAQPSTGGRETAVRIIHSEFASQPGVRDRHKRAISAGTRLSQHAHILPLAGHGDDGGYLYLASPFVAEGTLNDWLQRGGRLGVADIGPFFKQLANAVAYAHSTGVVHGNLKPANIFMFEGRHVLLGDFGMLWDPTNIDMHRPGPGSQAAEWLAPETFNGRFSQASDMYALGIILFAIITGRTPFRGATPAEVFEGHAHQPVPPLLRFDASLPPQFREFDAVLAQALAKRPEERFASAALLAQAIEQAAQAVPAAPQPGGWQQPGAGSLPGAPGGFPAAQAMPGFGKPAAPFPAAPGGMPGMQQAAPLNPMPFPSNVLGGLMDEGGISFKWNEALPRPEMAPRPPAAPRQEPPDERTVRMPAPQPPVAQPPIPTPLPMPMPFPVPSGMNGYNTGGPGRMPGMTQSAPPMLAAPNAFPVPDLAPLPTEAPRDHKGFSSQELGLPRLTYADLGDGLSKDLEEQMRAGVEGSSLQIMVAGEPEQRVYSARGKPPAHDDGESSMALSAAQPAARSHREMSHEYSEELSAQMSAPVRSRRSSRRRDEAYSEEMASVEMPQRRSRRDRYEDDESRYERAYENRRSRRSRRRSRYEEEDDEPRGREQLVSTLIFGVLPLLLFGMLALIVIRPQVCPGGLCDKVSLTAHRYVPVLNKVSGGAMTMTESPAQVSVNAQVGTAQTSQITLGGARSVSMTWRATSDLDWVSVSPASGTLTQGGTATISVIASPTTVKAGTYTGNVTITSDASTFVVPVKVTVTLGPKLGVQATPLKVTSCFTPVSLPVQNTGDAPLTINATSPDAAVTIDGVPLTVAPGASGNLTIGAKCGTAVHGKTYTLQVTSNGGSAQVQVQY